MIGAQAGPARQERRPDQYDGGAWNDDHNVMSGLDPDDARIGDAIPLQDFNKGSKEGSDSNNYCCPGWTRPPSPYLGARFGGAHPGGMNAVFADGSVHNIGWNVSQPVFAALCDRRDGTTVDLSELQ